MLLSFQECMVGVDILLYAFLETKDVARINFAYVRNKILFFAGETFHIEEYDVRHGSDKGCL